MLNNQHIQEHTNHVLNLTVNGKHFHWQEQYITGTEVRKLGNIAKEDDIFLTVKKPWVDELISDETRINLARPEIEHFISKEKPFSVTFIVNGREKTWNQKTISFEQLVILAFGKYDNNASSAYTVTYDRGHGDKTEGSMVHGDTILVKSKMIFNVARTDKS